MASSYYQRVAANKADMFKFENGALTLLNIYGYMKTVLGTVQIEKLFEENFDPKRVADLFFLLGQEQSYTAGGWLVAKAGVSLKNNEGRFAKELLGQTEIVGYGIPTILTMDVAQKSALIAIENNKYTNIRSAIYGLESEPSNHYFRGVLAGVFKFVFEEPVIVTYDPSQARMSKITYKVTSVREVRERGLHDLEKFIPSDDLRIDHLPNYNVKNLILQ